MIDPLNLLFVESIRLAVRFMREAIWKALNCDSLLSGLGFL